MLCNEVKRVVIWPTLLKSFGFMLLPGTLICWMAMPLVARFGGKGWPISLAMSEVFPVLCAQRHVVVSECYALNWSSLSRCAMCSNWQEKLFNISIFSVNFKVCIHVFCLAYVQLLPWENAVCSHSQHVTQGSTCSTWANMADECSRPCWPCRPSLPPPFMWSCPAFQHGVLARCKLRIGRVSESNRCYTVRKGLWERTTLGRRYFFPPTL